MTNKKIGRLTVEELLNKKVELEKSNQHQSDYYLHIVKELDMRAAKAVKI